MRLSREPLAYIPQHQSDAELCAECAEYTSKHERSHEPERKSMVGSASWCNAGPCSCTRARERAFYHDAGQCKSRVIYFLFPVLGATRRVDHAAEKRSVRRDVLTQVQYESTQAEKTRGHLEVPKTTHRQSLRPERQKS